MGTSHNVTCPEGPQAIAISTTWAGPWRQAGPGHAWVSAEFTPSEASVGAVAWLDASDDGTNVTASLSIAAATAATFEINKRCRGRYFRARFVNGATAQTALKCSTAATVA